MARIWEGTGQSGSVSALEADVQDYKYKANLNNRLYFPLTQKKDERLQKSEKRVTFSRGKQMNEGKEPNPPKEKGKNMKHLFSSSLP